MTTRTPPTAEYLGYIDELYDACRRDHGYTPLDWIMENNDGEEHKQLLFSQMKGTIMAAYRRGTAPSTLSAWLGDNIFNTNAWTDDDCV